MIINTRRPQFQHFQFTDPADPSFPHSKWVSFTDHRIVDETRQERHDQKHNDIR